jgi:hypothetical protein
MNFLVNTIFCCGYYKFCINFRSKDALYAHKMDIIESFYDLGFDLEKIE